MDIWATLTRIYFSTESYSKKFMIAMNYIPFSSIFLHPRKQHKILPFMRATELVKSTEASRTCYDALSSFGYSMTHISKGIRPCILSKLLHSKLTLPPTVLVLPPQLSVQLSEVQSMAFRLWFFIRETRPLWPYVQLYDKDNSQIQHIIFLFFSF